MFTSFYKDIVYHTSEWLFMSPLMHSGYLFWAWGGRGRGFLRNQWSSVCSILCWIPNVNRIWSDMPPKEPPKHPQLFFFHILLLYSFLSSLMVLKTESLIQKIVVVILQWFPTTVEDYFIATNIMNKVLYNSFFLYCNKAFFKWNSLPQ